MITLSQFLHRLRARPRIERIEPVYSQRLPAGRALVDVEVSGWGLLRVQRAGPVLYTECGVHRFAVPLGTVMRVQVWNPFGRDKDEYRPEPTLAQAPDRQSAPLVAVDVLSAGLGADPGRSIASTVPLSFKMQLPQLRRVEPRCGAALPIVSRRPRLPGGPAAIAATIAGVRMAPLRRERLQPPTTPPDELSSDRY